MSQYAYRFTFMKGRMITEVTVVSSDIPSAEKKVREAKEWGAEQLLVRSETIALIEVM